MQPTFTSLTLQLIKYRVRDEASSLKTEVVIMHYLTGLSHSSGGSDKNNGRVKIS
jgi:hypothetical protein